MLSGSDMNHGANVKGGMTTLRIDHGRGDAAPSKGGETTKGESSSEIASRQRCVNGQGGCQRVRPGR